MNRFALKMLLGEPGKYFGILLGITFASLLITLQGSVFTGVMTRTISFIRDLGEPDIWVMDRKVQFIDDIKPLPDTALYRVRAVEGVQWAVPLYKGILKARLPSGEFQSCNVLGLDDVSLVGGPPAMVAGTLADLRRTDGVIVDEVGANTKLAATDPATGRKIPVAIGDTIELNDHRAVVVGICQVSRTFQSQPVIYTTFSRATAFAPRERKLLGFILVKARPGADQDQLCTRIAQETGLGARTSDGFKWTTLVYFMKMTGIPINIGIGVLLALIVGTAISGQTFYTFTLDNLRYLGALKAMGASNGLLTRMVLLQALWVGCLGYGLGVGLASLIGYAARGTEMAFRMPWQLLLISGCAVVLICLFAAALSIRTVLKLEPAIVFRS